MSNKIRLLPSQLVNRIAAGEVIESPASALKEIVENSLDAGAKNILIELESGGKQSIKVVDDGHGMSKQEISYALQRHATSKMPNDNLYKILYFGFRGEALPAIGSVSKLTLISRDQDENHGWIIVLQNGELGKLKPSALDKGTIVKIDDLFHKFPARLKFLKTEKNEAEKCYNVIKKLAISKPEVSFEMRSSGKIVFDYKACINPNMLAKRKERLSLILGETFHNEAVSLNFKNDEINLTGMISLPTMNRSSSNNIYLFVKNRPIVDKKLIYAIRIAYGDMLPKGRYPVAALFIETSDENVDVNVHPAKSEVRFRNLHKVTSFIINSIKIALHNNSNKSTRESGNNAIRYFSNNNNLFSKSLVKNSNFDQKGFFNDSPPKTNEVFNEDIIELDFPLGAPKAQLHKTYVLSETKNGICIVDQHAAHERLVMEEMKKEIVDGKVSTQTLLMPEIIKLSKDQLESILRFSSELEVFGLHIESFGNDEVLVRETPAILGEINTELLLKNIAEELLDFEGSSIIEKKINEVIATMACHNSVRAGRKLNSDEMSSLLRKMENTPSSGQCNHGRPTFIELSINDLERLFGRK